MRVRAVLFDFDGVCIPVDIHYEACRHTCRHFDIECPTREFWRIGTKPPFADFYLVRGAKTTSAEIWRVYGEFIRANSERVLVFPDVSRCLPSLEKTYKLAIVSGGSNGWATSILSRAGLEDHFLRITTQVEFKQRAIVDTISALGVDPNETVFVGDTTYDMEDALKAGILPIGMTRGLATAKELMGAGARYCVDDFHELVEVIGCLERNGN